MHFVMIMCWELLISSAFLHLGETDITLGNAWMDVAIDDVRNFIKYLRHGISVQIVNMPIW